MKKHTLLILLAALAIAAAIVAVQAVTTRPAQEATASSVDGYALYTWTHNGIIAGANGTGRWTADYGRLECYQTVDVTLMNAVTTTFQSSPDNSNWTAAPAWQFATNVLAVGAGLGGVEADGTTFGITVLEGFYTRPVFALANIHPITITLRCVAKDRPGYDIDQEAGALESTD
jgi:hypothetical protein